MSSTNLVTNSLDDTRVSSTPPSSRPFTTKDVQRFYQVDMLARSRPSEMLDRQEELVKQAKDVYETEVLPRLSLQTIPAHLLEDHVRRLRTAFSVAQVIEAGLPGAFAILQDEDMMHKIVVRICTLKTQSRRLTPHNPTFVISVGTLNDVLLDMQDFVWRTLAAHDSEDLKTSANKKGESCTSKQPEASEGEDLDPTLLKIFEDIASLSLSAPQSES
ncbi:hypothetical protein K523DRAFT_249090 [Schizophyllum commune Tattone D]|nr:hypothetical protein K523DRAFT_249090 [Schizophyllum commune Tattone D]